MKPTLINFELGQTLRTMQNLFLYGARAKGDGADTFSEQHGSGAQRFFGCFRGGAHTFLGMCGESKLPIGH